MPRLLIERCFTEPLPTFPSGGGTASASVSGSATHETDAPAFSRSVGSQRWIDGGTQLATRQTHTLSQEYLYRDEQSIYHANEGDIVRSSALYLLYPINQALYAEARNNNYGMIRCQSEQTTNFVRADISYYKNVSNSGDMRPFAVLEFKKRGVIVPGEFEAAQKAGGDTRTLVQSAQQQNDASFFVGNSRTLIKQAASYAIRHRTQYVALFDWDTLVLVKFVSMNPGLSTHDLSQEGVGDYCETTIMKQSHNMRAALLGFLWEAVIQAP